MRGHLGDEVRRGADISAYAWREVTNQHSDPGPQLAGASLKSMHVVRKLEVHVGKGRRSSQEGPQRRAAGGLAKQVHGNAEYPGQLFRTENTCGLSLGRHQGRGC